MITQKQVSLVRNSWSQVEPIAEQAAALFYGKLFELDPAVKPLFTSDIKEQGVKLMKTIGLAVRSLDDVQSVVPALQALGKKHKELGVQEEHYATVATALLDTLEKGLGDAFTDETKEAWTLVYGVVSSTMIESAEY